MNNPNDASKRTVAQVKAILNQAGIQYTNIENLGDNRTFMVYHTNEQAIRVRGQLRMNKFIRNDAGDTWTEIACW